MALEQNTHDVNWRRKKIAKEDHPKRPLITNERRVNKVLFELQVFNVPTFADDNGLHAGDSR